MDKKLGKIDAKKSLGQHFLNNSGVPKRMADAGEVKAGDIVLEIGPGTGVLTRELLARGACVVALEADQRAIETLNESFESEINTKNLVILHADVRTFPELILEKNGQSARKTLISLGITNGNYKVIANIPYYLSGFLFRTFLETDVQPTTLVYLVQREVGERIARDKKESLLSLSVKMFGDPAYIGTIKPGNFTPPPKVDSAIIAITCISRSRLTKIDETFFFELIHAGFASKRKQLLGNLTKLFTRETLIHTFSTLNIPMDVRGEDLHLDMWLTLTRSLALHR